MGCLATLGGGGIGKENRGGISLILRAKSARRYEKFWRIGADCPNKHPSPSPFAVHCPQQKQSFLFFYRPEIGAWRSGGLATAGAINRGTFRRFSGTGFAASHANNWHPSQNRRKSVPKQPEQCRKKRAIARKKQPESLPLP